MATRKKTTPQKKPRAPRTPTGDKNPEDRMFSGAKLKRVLSERFQLDFRRFVNEYDSFTGRVRRSAPLSEDEKSAIQRFMRDHQSIQQLANELGCAITSAHARITKYVLEESHSESD